MKLSECCGTAMKLEYRPDAPQFYDDPDNFQIPVRVCTNCGKVYELNTAETCTDEEN